MYGQLVSVNLQLQLLLRHCAVDTLGVLELPVLVVLVVFLVTETGNVFGSHPPRSVADAFASVRTS